MPLPVKLKKYISGLESDLPLTPPGPSPTAGPMVGAPTPGVPVPGVVSGASTTAPMPPNPATDALNNPPFDTMAPGSAPLTDPNSTGLGEIIQQLMAAMAQQGTQNQDAFAHGRSMVGGRMPMPLGSTPPVPPGGVGKDIALPGDTVDTPKPEDAIALLLKQRLKGGGR